MDRYAPLAPLCAPATGAVPLRCSVNTVRHRYQCIASVSIVVAPLPHVDRRYDHNAVNACIWHALHMFLLLLWDLGS